MGAKTGVIRYNVKERGRRFRGQDRNFDTVALAALINGPEVQEKVKNGDMLGYWGHWPRLKFGFEVEEGAVVGGKVVHLEPAIRTTSIRAFDDGTIEHEEEFLDTAPGRLIRRMFESKVGGFSSVIIAPRRGSQQVAQSFHGFDYVKEPNYTTNRGYTLDSAGNRIETSDLPEDEQMVLDAVAEYDALVDATNAMLDRVQGEYDQQATVLTALHEENVELHAAVRRAEEALDSARSEAAAATKALADLATANEAATEDAGAKPAGVLDSASSRFAHAGEFKNARLEGFEPVKDAGEKPEGNQAVDDYLAKAHGIR